MCKGPNEPGGPSRCATDTRRIHDEKLKVMFLANRSGDPIAMKRAGEEWEAAAVEYASTMTGRDYMIKLAKAAEERGDAQRADLYYSIARRGRQISTMHAEVRKRKAAEERQREVNRINEEAVSAGGQPEIIRGISREMIASCERFYPIESPNFPETMSGWKVHISATNMQEMWGAWERVAETVMERGLVGKFAGGKMLQHWEETGSPQRLKGLTLYFPRRETLEEDLGAVIAATKGIRDDVPMGDYQVAPGVGLRYEFGDYDPGDDLDMYSYRSAYVSAGDKFHAPDSALADLGVHSPLARV